MNDATIFATALEKADLAERAAYLSEACGNDAARRDRVEKLLIAHDRAGGFLERPAVEGIPAATETTQTHRENDSPDPHLRTRTYETDSEMRDEDALGILQPSSKPGSLGRIGHYDVLEILGRGGFGIVYRAFDEKLQRVVAVKILAPHMAATSPARKRFLREARSSAAVRHDNVVQVHAVVEDPLPYLVMEYIPGETLQQRIDRTGPLDLQEVLRIGRQVADGLAAAHATGLVHRDIKPANVLIDSGPYARVKLTDFGLARAADDASISQSGVVAGTPMYMAPEQARGDNLDHRADLFSLGSVLYVLCTGRPPFRANSTLAVLKRVVEDDPRPIREIIPEVPEWFCRIVEKLHAKKPDERFQTAKDVADVLADCEIQLKDHAKLTDFKNIPHARSKPPRQANLKLAFASILFSFLILAIWAGPFAYRYAQNRGEIEFKGEVDFDIKKILVRIQENGAAVATLDRDNPRASLPPNNYVLEAVSEVGYEATKFQVRTKRLLSGGGSFERVADRPAIHLTVIRGDFTTVAATTEKQTPRPAPPLSADGTGLQGTWTAVSVQMQGNDFPAEALKSFGMTFAGNRAHIKTGAVGMGGMVNEYAFTISPGRTPKEIDFELKGFKPVQGIYKLEGDRLTICMGDAGDPRPERFETRPDPKESRMLAVFRRAVSDGFVPLFNGKDLTGWKSFPDNRATWRVLDGVLVGSGKPSHLFSERGNFSNFHLRMETRIKRHAKAGAVGIFARVPFEDPGIMLSPHGEGGLFRSPVPKLYDDKAAPPDSAPPTYREKPLVLWGLDHKGEKTTINSFPADEWFTHELIVDGQNVTVKTESKEQSSKSSVFAGAPAGSGHLALQLFDDWSVVEFRKIEIKELTASTPASDEDRLQGTWVPFEAESGGKKMPAERLGGMKFIGDKVYVTVQGRQQREGTFKLGANNNPKEIDVIRNEDFRGMRGIYRFDTDVLTLCVDEPGPTRPTKFETTPDTGTLLLMKFRKIEIRELPSGSPGVPKRAADVLPFLAGNWKVEMQTFEPKPPPDAVPAVGQMALDFVADGKVLRSRATAVSGLDEIRFLYSFDDEKNVLRQWQAWSNGNAHGPFMGLFNPDNRTMTWRHKLNNNIESTSQFDFINPDTIRTRLVHQDASDKIVREMRMTFTRIQGPIALSSRPADPNRPAEMKVLDRLIGEWRNEVSIKSAAMPGKEKVETVWAKAESIFGGRFVEVIETNEANKSNDYTLAWFDAVAKQYRQWVFSNRGDVYELRGSWNDATKTITWNSFDNTRIGHWTFKSDDVYELRRAVKNGDGKTLYEANGVSRRRSAPETELKPGLQP